MVLPIPSPHVATHPVSSWPTVIVVSMNALALLIQPVDAAPLMAGAAKVEITNVEAGPVNDPLYVKALVVKSETTTAVIVTVDAVAIGEIGHIKNDYLAKVRERIETELHIDPANVLINASHCHGVVCSDVDERTFQAVKARHRTWCRYASEPAAAAKTESWKTAGSS